MQERDIRRYHGLFGVILALFILVQVGSGTLIAFNKLAGQTGMPMPPMMTTDLRRRKATPAMTTMPTCCFGPITMAVPSHS